MPDLKFGRAGSQSTIVALFSIGASGVVPASMKPRRFAADNMPEHWRSSLPCERQSFVTTMHNVVTLEKPMEISVRALKSRLSETLRRVAEGEEVVVTSHGKAVARLTAPRSARQARAPKLEEVVALLRSQPWVRPGKGKPRLPRYVLRLKPGEKTLAEIVSEERG
jgi:prevent-host-death family protein